ncbi:MAG: response regulator transcription factor [Blastocatellia bacterium]
MNTEINIVIADDHPIVRKGLCQVITSDPLLKVIGEADDGESALREIRRLRPAIAVLDVEMPKRDGFGIVRELQNDALPIEILFLTLHNDAEHFYAALDLAVKGYILKDSAAGEIVTGIKTVAAGRHYVTASLTALLLERRRVAAVAANPSVNWQQLTPTERLILQMIAHYKSSKDIAEELFIHYRTVENHRTNICQKLGIRGHNALLKFALQHKSQL